MDRQEAKRLLTTRLDEYRKLEYADFVQRIGEIDCLEVTGPSGVEYQIEVQFMWDGKPGAGVFVSAGIDDGGWSAFAPLCEGFFVSADERPKKT